MEYRRFGKTDLQVSVLGFGCGAVGGLMVRGEHQQMIRSVDYALNSGINYFDTARMYGDGLSEIHTGAVLRELNASEALIGTKVRVDNYEMGEIERDVSLQIDNSLRRLGADHVDIVYTHNRIGSSRLADQDALTLEDLERVVSVFDEAVAAGKISHWGFNALGDTEVIHIAIKKFQPAGIHTCYNMLNPSSGYEVPAGFPYQNYNNLITLTDDLGLGSVGIRILAAGALTGSEKRHTLAAQEVAPIATGKTLQEDLARTSLFEFLVKEGFVKSIVEGAIRFALSNGKLSTALVGFSSFRQLKDAVSAAEMGPLPQEVLDRISGTWAAQ